MELLKITDKLFVVPAQNKGRFPFSLSVYVDAERKILFDAGIGNKLLRAFLHEYPVDIVIFSHAHADHIAGAGLLGNRAPLFVPAESRDIFGDLGAMGGKFFTDPQAMQYWDRLFREGVQFHPSAATRTYDGRSAFELEDVRLVAIHTPGHSEDHYCFFEERSGTLLLFDVDLSPSGPWYGDPGSSIEQYEASLALLRATNAEMAFSSHMGVLRKEVSKRLESFGNILQAREERLLDMLKGGPKSAEALAKQFPFTPRHMEQLRPLYLYWETNMVKKHLDRLIEAGSVNPSKDGYHRVS